MKTFVFLAVIAIALGWGGLITKKAVDDERSAQQLAAASLKRPDYAVTVIPGKRREEIALQMQAAGICSATDFMSASTGKEGMLFPDTYRFYKDTPAGQVVNEMTSDFTTRTATDPPSANQLILASIVEREALSDADRPLIAGIYQHRLNIGMRLQSDPTVQYANDTNAEGAGLLSTPYWQPITAADYTDVVSPFNTYLIPALPPTPISEPSLSSIQAAENPTATKQLYFLYENGTLLTSSTLAGHLAQE
jgi:UPF0755 protein